MASRTPTLQSAVWVTCIDEIMHAVRENAWPRQRPSLLVNDLSRSRYRGADAGTGVRRAVSWDAEAGADVLASRFGVPRLASRFSARRCSARNIYSDSTVDRRSVLCSYFFLVSLLS